MNRRVHGRRRQAVLWLWLCCLLMLLSAVARADSRILELRGPDAVLTARLQPGSDWPAGPTVLLLHGTLSHRDTEIIESLEALLADAGVATLAVNLGLGIDRREAALACDSEHRHLESDASSELALWIGWLQEQGVTDITLLGHSRGAYQVARYRLNSGDERVRRLVLVAPPTWSSEQMRDAYQARHAAALDPLLAEARAMQAAGRGRELLPGTVGLLYCEGGRVSADALLSYYGDDPLRDTPTLLTHLDTPTLLVSGSEDTVAAGLGEALEAIDAARRHHVRALEIDGADHFFRDLYADELIDNLLEFLDDTL
jgi:pimeloyl-ACP methyl ester carboxylesterase